MNTMAEPAGHSYVDSSGLSGSMSVGREKADLWLPLMNFVPCNKQQDPAAQ